MVTPNITRDLRELFDRARREGNTPREWRLTKTTFNSLCKELSPGLGYKLEGKAEEKSNQQVNSLIYLLILSLMNQEINYFVKKEITVEKGRNKLVEGYSYILISY